MSELQPIATSSITAAQVVSDECPAPLLELGKLAAAFHDKLVAGEAKLEQYKIAMSLVLAQAEKVCDADGFTAFHKRFCPRLSSRAKELLQIETGKKTLEDVRAATLERVKRYRAKKSAQQLSVTAEAAVTPPKETQAPSAVAGAGSNEDAAASGERRKQLHRDTEKQPGEQPDEYLEVEETPPSSGMVGQPDDRAAHENDRAPEAGEVIDDEAGADSEQPIDDDAGERSQLKKTVATFLDALLAAANEDGPIVLNLDHVVSFLANTGLFSVEMQHGIVVKLMARLNSSFNSSEQPAEPRAVEPAPEPTVEEAEAEVARLKLLKATTATNVGADTEIDDAADAKAFAEFKAACTYLPELSSKYLRKAIDHFAEVVEVPAEELMPHDVKSMQIDLKIAKAEVTALKRKLAGKLPPRESRVAAWVRLTEVGVDALEQLIDYQQQFEEMKNSLPENLQNSAQAEKCQAICDLDLESALSTLQEAADAEVPLGWGRD